MLFSNTSRLFIGLVAAWNLQAAFAFVFFPANYVGAYELSGTAGEAAVRGIGVLFVMWNIPYLFALKDPLQYRLALTLALLMQVTGLVGESYILSTLGMENAILRSSILRFIAFDGAGALLLGLAYWMTKE